MRASPSGSPRVKPFDIENAVLQLYAERRLRAGDRLRLSELRHEWPRTRLRRSDLIDGIRQLVYAGALHLHREGDEESELALTDAGHARSADLPLTPRGNWALHLVDRLLHPAVDDEAALAGMGPRRRLSDLPGHR